MNTVLLWLAGLGAGVLGAMGLGGGGVLMLWLGFLPLSQRAAQGINLVFILPVGLAGLWFHRKNGLVETAVLPPILLGGVIGVAAGSLAAGWLPDTTLRALFGVLLLVLGGRELWVGIRLFRSPPKSE